MASGWTYPAGLLPALATENRSLAAARKKPSAMWLRQELPVQRTRTIGLSCIRQRQHVALWSVGRGLKASDFGAGGRHLSSARQAVCLVPRTSSSASPWGSAALMGNWEMNGASYST